MVRSPTSARHDGALMGACGAPDPPLTGTTEIVWGAGMVIVELAVLGLILVSLLVLPHLDG